MAFSSKQLAVKGKRRFVRLPIYHPSRQRLVQQRDRAKGMRKVLFVITDGMRPQRREGCGRIHRNGLWHGDRQSSNWLAPHGIFRDEAAVNVRKVDETGLKQLTALLERGL